MDTKLTADLLHSSAGILDVVVLREVISLCILLFTYPNLYSAPQLYYRMLCCAAAPIERTSVRVHSADKAVREGEDCS